MYLLRFEYTRSADIMDGVLHDFGVLLISFLTSMRYQSFKIC